VYTHTHTRELIQTIAFLNEMRLYTRFCCKTCSWSILLIRSWSCIRRNC